MKRHLRTKRDRSANALLAILMVIVLAAAACSGGSDEGADSESFDGAEEGGAFAPTEDMAADEAAAEEFEVEEAEAVAEGEASDALADQDESLDEEVDPANADSPLGSGTQAAPTAADFGRQLIFTAVVSVEVDDVSAASSEAISIVENEGGFVFGQNTVGGAEPSSELVFKVLPDDFNRVLAALGMVGELRNQSVTTDDVTERIVDLESRIEVADLGVARLRTALEGAASLEDYAELERLLLDRESELEVMRGQLRTLQDRVDLATITLVLTQDRVENAIDLRVSTYAGHDEGISCSGQQETILEAGSEATVCFDIVNIGDQTLTDIALTDTALGIDGETTLIEVFGSLDELAPGQSVVVAHQITPERNLLLRTRVIAIPTDGVSSEQAGPSVNIQVPSEIRTFEPEESAGFGDGFSIAVSILAGLWIGLKVGIGFLVPLLVLAPFVWLAWRGWREFRRRRPRKVAPPKATPTPWPGSFTPPPPGPTPPPAPVPTSPTAEVAGSVGGTEAASPEEGSPDGGSPGQR